MVWLDILVWFRQHTTPWLDALMGGITYLGSAYFYLGALCLLYWCVDLAMALRLFVLFLSTVYLGEAVKEITAVPRPFQVAPNLGAQFKETAGGFSFPSAHALDATVFWGYLAITVRRRWMYIVAPLLVLLVSFSRIFLGLHWPQDVIAGIVFGLIILGCGYVALRLLAGMPIQARFPSTLVFCLVPVILFVLFPSSAGAQTMGTLFGAILGYLLERRYIGFAVRRPLWQQVLKMVIGLAGAALLMLGLSAVLQPLNPADIVRVAGDSTQVPGGFLYTWGREIPTWLHYALVGIWFTLGAPALFRLLFGKEEAKPPTT